MRSFVLTLVSLLFIAGLPLPAQQTLSEEEKRRLFLKAREEMTTIPYTPPAETLTTPKPKPRVTTPAPTPRPIVTPPTTPTTPRPTSTPPTPQPTTPKPTPPPTPVPVPLRPIEQPKANIIVKESGIGTADEEKDEPAEPKEGFWSRVFGGSRSYKYLTPSVRKAIDRAPVRKGRWRFIVIHNSATRQGSAKAFEHYHRYVRKMPNGLAYHFVIGNGTSTGNGAIEIGNRWHRQMQGGHVHSDNLNNISLGICFVGDFNNDKPKKEQLEACAELIDYLRRRVGRVNGHTAAVRAHRAINPPRWPTDCPGDRFPYAWIERF